jgi:hypothetical protein
MERDLILSKFGVKGFAPWRRSSRKVADGVNCSECGAPADSELVEHLRERPDFSERPSFFVEPGEVDLTRVTTALGKECKLRGPEEGYLVDTAREARFVDATTLGLSTVGLAALRRKLGSNECKVYEHQAKAIRHSLASRPMMLATATASGKSLCFQVPIIESIATAKKGQTPTAIYLGPMKALIQDQFRSIQEFGVHQSDRRDPELTRYLATMTLVPRIRNSLRNRPGCDLSLPWETQAGQRRNSSSRRRSNLNWSGLRGVRA